MRTLNVLFAAFGNMIGSVMVLNFFRLKIRWDDKQHRNDYCQQSIEQDPDGEIENSEKGIFEIRIPNFCYIQVIVFDLSYLPVAAAGTQQVRYHKKYEN